MPKFPPRDIGDLRRPCYIQQEISTPDSQGGSVKSWQDVIKVWCAFSAWKGVEVLQSQQTSTNQWWEVDCRFPPNSRILVDDSMRLIDNVNGKIYNIRFVADPDFMRAQLHMTCEAIRQKQS